MSFQVNSVHPIQYLYSGVFQDERVLQLLYIMQKLGESCFRKLDEVSKEGNPSPSEYIRRFRKGLESIGHWKSDVRAAEANEAVQKYPELSMLYKYAIVRYLKELYKNEKKAKIPISIPPFHDFLHTYYQSLAESACMARMEFFNIYGLQRSHVHMEALRDTLIVSTRGSVYYSQTSYDPSTYYKSDGIDGLLRVEKDLTQWDSVSQRGAYQGYTDPHMEENERSNVNAASKDIVYMNGGGGGGGGGGNDHLPLTKDTLKELDKANWGVGNNKNQNRRNSHNNTNTNTNTNHNPTHPSKLSKPINLAKPANQLNRSSQNQDVRHRNSNHQSARFFNPPNRPSSTLDKATKKFMTKEKEPDKMSPSLHPSRHSRASSNNSNTSSHHTINLDLPPSIAPSIPQPIYEHPEIPINPVVDASKPPELRHDDHSDDSEREIDSPVSSPSKRSKSQNLPYGFL